MRLSLIFVSELRIIKTLVRVKTVCEYADKKKQNFRLNSIKNFND